MLWLEPVIGTAPWCWWQVPARRSQRRVGTLRAGLALGRLGSSLMIVMSRFSWGRQSATPPQEMKDRQQRVTILSGHHRTRLAAVHKSIKNLSLNRKRMGVEVGTRRQNSILHCSTILYWNSVVQQCRCSVPLLQQFENYLHAPH
jgi:hypothetical protein